jgi:hypothetical protein
VILKKGDLRILSIFALIFLVPFALWIWDWYLLRSSGSWWPKLAIGAPFLAVSEVGGLVLNASLPGGMNDPWESRSKNAKTIWLGIIALGLLTGTINYFVMDSASRAQQAAPVYTPPPGQ